MDISPVGHYLWGIDTYRAADARCLLFHQEVGHYLWGIDTFFVALTTDATGATASRTLPMRNWYTPRFPFFVVPVSRSDITYEELILKILCCRSDCVKLSDITYEELIRIHIIHSKVFIKDFILSDITYEELIPAHLLQTRPLWRIWSVGHYLWGIDTNCGKTAIMPE